MHEALTGRVQKPILPKGGTWSGLQREVVVLVLHLADLDVEVLALFDLGDPAVADPHDAVRYVEHLEVVCRGDDRHVLLAVELLQELDDFGSGFEVEVPGRFVRPG